LANHLRGKLGPDGQPIRMPIARPKVIGPEANPWYWNPNRVGVRTAPPSFMERLHSELGSELEVTWNPIRERWQVFSRAPKVTHPICSGWRLLFIHEGPDKEYLPLDERVFARLYFSSVMAHGSARQYFDRMQREAERDKERAEQAEFQDTMDRAMEYGWDFSRIKVSGCGQSSGSKFSEFHS
jgi:hypothetical protein